MERRLHEAAIKGSVSSLIRLLEEDPLILDRVIVDCVAETPLHIAALLGHFDFAREILQQKPELACEKDLRRLSPLHLASAKGYVDITRELLRINSEVCLARDRDGRTPLHLAAMKGRVEVLRELIGAKTEAARVLGDRGETVLHLCVKHDQLEALKLLMDSIGDSEFVNSKDEDGNSLLHLAVADKQIETVKLLIRSAEETINTLNGSGLTALDVLERGPRDLKDMDIAELLREAGALRAKEMHMNAYNTKFMRTDREVNTARTPPGSGMEEKLKKHEDWLRKKRNTLMVVASLVATMAFQAGVNPPGGVWQDDKPEGNRKHIAGMAIMPSNFPVGYPRFLGLNTISFIASLSIILLLISGLPMKRRIFMWILMVITWVAITATALTYLLSILALTEEQTREEGVYAVLGYSILCWAGIMAILLLVHTFRLILKMLRKMGMLKRRASRGVVNFEIPPMFESQDPFDAFCVCCSN